MKLWLADDAVFIRDSLAAVLESDGHQVTRTFADARSLAAAGTQPDADLPDVTVADVRMPPGMADDGLHAILAILRVHPDHNVFLLSQYLAPESARQLLDPHAAGTGGKGYALKDKIMDLADFTRQLRLVADGGLVVDPHVAAHLAATLPRIASLSARERECLQLMAAGLDNKQIAQKMHISTSAVSKYIAGVFQRLNLPQHEGNRRVQAVLAYLGAAGRLDNH